MAEERFAAAALSAWTTTSSVVLWTAYVALGYLWMGIVTFMHDGTHDTLFARPWLNTAFGVVAMIPIGVSFIAFQRDHLEHHRYNRSPRDLDAFTMGRRGAAARAPRIPPAGAAALAPAGIAGRQDS